ncbi:hypothetical protein MBLNU230_g1511t1 [Neophaeotheca triangularis]
MHSLHLLLAGCLTWQTVHAVDPLVHLGYTSYRGTPLQNGITQWLGVRYAAPPVGDLRFREPQDPPGSHGYNQNVVGADVPGPICLATNAGPPTDDMQEDCLFLNVYAPSGTNWDAKLPVFFFIQGGGFNANSNPNYNGTGLVEAGDKELIVVTINYRVGPYGFLASQEVLNDGSVNNGLKDQRKALEWVQRYIHLFGGDSGHVTIGGASAGAASINLQSTAYGGRDDGLFHATAAESQSFAAVRTVDESQYQYDLLAARANCESSYRDTLSCLRSLSATDLQAINFNTPFPGALNPPLYMYNPVIDDDFIRQVTYSAYANGNFVHVPALAGDTTNEGTIFTPRDTNSYDDSNVFIKDQFPLITSEQLSVWDSLYPVEDFPEFPNSGRFWRQLSQGYGEMRYTCPGIFISDTYANYSVYGNWNYRWNVIDPPAQEEGLGVSHTIEVNAIFGPANTNGGAPDSYQPGGINNDIVAVAQGYWTSFIRTKNPNTLRAPGSPQWREWTQADRYQRIMFQTGETQMEGISQQQLDRCEYLWSIGVELRQ